MILFEEPIQLLKAIGMLLTLEFILVLTNLHIFLDPKWTTSREVSGVANKDPEITWEQLI